MIVLDDIDEHDDEDSDVDLKTEEYSLLWLDAAAAAAADDDDEYSFVLGLFESFSNWWQAR